MLELNSKKKLQAAITILFIAVVAYASSLGPESRHTGAPGETTCTECHSSSPLNSNGVNIEIGGLPATYEPGRQYPLTVTVRQANRFIFGFQLTVIDANGNRAGTLESINNTTQLNGQTGAGGRQYIQHTDIGSQAPVAGSRTWQIRWTAPATDVGFVRFYAAGNAANGDGDVSGDLIYAAVATVDPLGGTVTATLQSQPDGMTLGVGSTYTISWNVTGASNIDNIELRYSTDDGATFPIGNQIFFTTDASVTSFDWVVPNAPTTQARIRMTVGTKSGAGITPIITDRFTIGSGGAASPPEITKAEVMGKQLIVTGEGFQQGATLYMCDSCAEPATQGNKVKKTSNDEVFGDTMLVSKKAGKQISRGSTVILQVKNADGLLSAPFTFTRPLE